MVQKDIMIMLKHICLLVGLLMATASCSDSLMSEDFVPGEVQLRVQNISKFKLDEVVLQPGTPSVQTYLGLEPGQTSSYQPFEFTYAYGYVRTIIGTDTLTLQPIDYVGETRIYDGAYTFIIDVIGEERPEYLVLDFQAD